MPSNHLILCRHLLLPPSVFPSIRVFSTSKDSYKYIELIWISQDHLPIPSSLGCICSLHFPLSQNLEDSQLPGRACEHLCWAGGITLPTHLSCLFPPLPTPADPPHDRSLEISEKCKIHLLGIFYLENICLLYKLLQTKISYNFMCVHKPINIYKICL